jgi:hypothetical protein
MKGVVKIRLEMTREQALEHGLLTCECTHPENNHFDFDERPCAHCDCKSYRERARVGKLLMVTK